MTPTFRLYTFKLLANQILGEFGHLHYNFNMNAKGTKPTSTRKFDRIDFASTPWSFGLSNFSIPELPLRLEAKNISMGGLKFSINHRVKLFEKLKISLVDPKKSADQITVVGKVVRVEETDTGQSEKYFGVAISFEELDPIMREKLEKVLPHSTPNILPQK